MANGKKVIMCIIGNTLFIDPRVTPNINIDVIKKKIPNGENLDVKFEPIDKWMPVTGTKALMDQAVKSLLPKPIPQEKKVDTYKMTRQQIRALNRKHKKL